MVYNVHMDSATTSRTLLIVALYWLIFAGGAFAMALGNTFAPWVCGAYLIGGALALMHDRVARSIHSMRIFVPNILATTLFLIITLSYATSDVFTGRDQGSIATAAIMLAEHGTTRVHTLASDTFAAFYGPGKALNFPGFYYAADGALTTQFPLPAIAFYAAFYGLFGHAGFLLANGLLFLLSTLLLTLSIALALRALRIARRSAWRTASIVAPALMFTQYTLTYVARHTLSENLAQFLVLLTVAGALHFATARQHAWYGFVAALGATALLVFARIEGIAVYAACILSLLILPHTAAQLRTRIVPYILVPTIGILALLAIVFRASTDFYRSIAVALLRGGGSGAQDIAVGADLISRWTDYISYGVAPLFLGAVISIILLFRRRIYTLLLPAAIVAPISIYLIDPHISSDAPWMLRRMSFALIPVSIFYAALLPHLLRRGALIVALIVALALPANIALFTVREHPSLLQQAQAIGAQLAPDDIILVDRGASGNPYALLSGALRTMPHVNAAYFFNPEDLRRIDFRAFRTVFLLVPDTAADRYMQQSGVTLTPRTRIPITTTHLMLPRTPRLYNFPHRTSITVQNTLFTVTRND